MKTNVMLLKKLGTVNSVSRRQALEKELQVQRQLNAELLKTCKQQRQLIDEQSLMISDILNDMGK